VGSISSGRIAQDILEKGQADVAIVGRQFQKNPGSVWTFAEELGVDVHLAHQIEWGKSVFIFALLMLFYNNNCVVFSGFKGRGFDRKMKAKA
jgi:hypothetical protein